MNIRLFLLTATFFLTVSAQSENRGSADASRNLISRVTSKSNIPIKITLIKNGEYPFFEYSVKQGVLYLKGNNSISICRGFYDYVKKNRLGVYSWSGNNIKLPQNLPTTDKVSVISPFKNHYYLNVVTYSYSMPYWGWERWEKEIDWMALHGINMPLTLIAHEAIMARVFKKIGFSEKDINEYYVGPAHLPFSRMGLIEKLDGPLDKSWYDQSIDLQHKVLSRMRSLGMKPICPAFAGFVPEGIKKLFPKTKVVKTHWGGAFNNWMISPEEKLFSELSTAFIQEWEKEFGKCTYYLSDSFNEMEIPFPPKEDPNRYKLLSNYGSAVYQSIKNANPNAVWVMQGWMFGYQRHIWDYNTLKALVSKVPDDKIILLDLAADYNKHFWNSEANWEFYKGFFNKQWVYSVIPNMGGKTGMTGVLDFYANGHLEALSSTNKGNLIAHGMAPEGIENNEVIYELLSDAGWSNKPINIDKWLEEYSYNRYENCTEDISKCWKLLSESVYGSFTDHPRYNWQFRPGTVKNGSIQINDSFFNAIESFIAAADIFKSSPLYQADLVEFTAHYLGAKAELLTKAIDIQYEKGDTLRAIKFEKDFLYILLGIDKLLSSHPTLRLENWLNYAMEKGYTLDKKRQYLKNARRIVTIWGPPVDDYSARIWSGLIRDYYLPRWENYFNYRKRNVRFNFEQWERDWVEHHELSAAKKPKNIIDEVRSLIDYCAFITPNLLKNSYNQSIGSWNVHPNNISEFTFNIPANSLKIIKSISILEKKNRDAWICKSFNLIADGRNIVSRNNIVGKNGIHIPIKIPENIRANNSCLLKIEIENKSDSLMQGNIYFNKRKE